MSAAVEHGTQVTAGPQGSATRVTAPLDFTVPGQPYGKGRARATIVRGKARLFTPEKTASYESLVALSAQQAMAGRPLFSGAVEVAMLICCQIPASWSGRKQQLAREGAIRPTTKPDIDNVEKAIFDGINGVVWKDDVQVVDVRKRKIYADTPRVVVTIWPADPLSPRAVNAALPGASASGAST